MPQPKKNGLDDFYELLKKYGNILAVGLGSAAILLITHLTSASPPWPPAVLQISAIYQLIALIFVHQFFTENSKSVFDRRICSFIIIFVGVSVAYFAANSLLIYSGTNGDRFVKGLICTADALDQFPKSCPILSDSEISTTGYEGEVLWTAVGLMLGRSVVLMLWVFFLTSIVFVVATFVQFQRNRKVRD